MKIFLDDNRRNPIDFELVRTVEDFENLVSENKENIEEISLDFDLSASGTSRTGLNACDFLVKNNVKCPKITIHSDHPKAVEMYSYLQEHMPECDVQMKKYSIIEVLKRYDD